MSRARARIGRTSPWFWTLFVSALSPVARADWNYELGYRFAHVDGAVPAGASYSADLQGVHLVFREAVGGWRGELAGGYQIGSADVEAPDQALDTSDETAWEAEYRIGPEIAPGVWTFGGIGHRRWDSDADSNQLQRRFTYSPVGIGLTLPAAWNVSSQVTAEYWAVWDVDVETPTARGALPDAGSGWRVATSFAWGYDDGQSLFVNPYYADWELDGGLSTNDVDARVAGINLGLRWR